MKHPKRNFWLTVAASLLLAVASGGTAVMPAPQAQAPAVTG